MDEAQEHGWEDEGVRSPENNVDGENEKVTKECVEAFKQHDSICEASVFKNLKRYFHAGGTPEEVNKTWVLFIRFLRHNRSYI